MRRDLTTIARRVAKVQARARAFVTRPLVLIDTAHLFDWQAFRNGDAETRETMRCEYVADEATLLAAYDVPTPSDPLAITAIHVRCYVPPASEEWRYETDADDPGRIDRPSRTPEEQARIDRFRETGEWGDETDVEPVDDVFDELDTEPWKDPSETLYIGRSGFPVTRREHQALRAIRLENDQRRADQRRHAETTRKG